jgi:hypothetical protein
MDSIGLGRSDADALLAEQDWADISRRLTLHAYARLRPRSRALAEEIAQSAIESILSAQRAPWDPTRHPDLFDYLGSIVNSLVSNHQTSHAASARRGTLREAERVADESESAEDRLASQEYAARAAEALRERVRRSDDTLCAKVMDLMTAGLEKPQDLAAAAGVHVSEINKAKKRLGAHFVAVRRELGEENGDGE